MLCLSRKVLLVSIAAMYHHADAAFVTGHEKENIIGAEQQASEKDINVKNGIPLSIINEAKKLGFNGDNLEAVQKERLNDILQSYLLELVDSDPARRPTPDSVSPSGTEQYAIPQEIQNQVNELLEKDLFKLFFPNADVSNDLEILKERSFITFQAIIVTHPEKLKLAEQEDSTRGDPEWHADGVPVALLSLTQNRTPFLMRHYKEFADNNYTMDDTDVKFISPFDLSVTGTVSENTLNLSDDAEFVGGRNVAKGPDLIIHARAPLSRGIMEDITILRGDDGGVSNILSEENKKALRQQKIVVDQKKFMAPTGVQNINKEEENSTPRIVLAFTLGGKPKKKPCARIGCTASAKRDGTSDFCTDYCEGLTNTFSSKSCLAEKCTNDRRGISAFCSTKCLPETVNLGKMCTREGCQSLRSGTSTFCSLYCLKFKKSDNGISCAPCLSLPTTTINLKMCAGAGCPGQASGTSEYCSLDCMPDGEEPEYPDDMPDWCEGW